MKKFSSLMAALLIPAMLLAGCGGSGSGNPPAVDNPPTVTLPSSPASPTPTDPTTPSTPSTTPDGDSSAVTETAIDTGALFSDRDFDIDYSSKKSAVIQLNGSTASCSSNAVEITGSTITILDEGTYILSGTLTDGMIRVNADKKDKIQLVLNGAEIHNETSAPIYVLQADKVFITTAPGSDNTLSNGGSFVPVDDSNIDAVIFSKEDLTLNGSGTLTLNSPAGHGIVSKDSLTITGGSYRISSASHALSGKDDVSIADGAFVLAAGKDGIRAENDDDPSLGLVCILGGTFDISAEGDGISASAQLLIENGDFDITAGGGSANATSKSSGNWGGFGGGMGGFGGFGGTGGRNPGSKPGATQNTPSTAATEDSAESSSMKGLKATGSLTVTGGTFRMDTADDAVHSNISVTISGGTFDIAAGDDAFHADDTLTVTDGVILISTSYEGLEGQHIRVSGGDITLTADDDGLNAAGGTDSSGITGGRDGMFGGGGKGGFGGGFGGSSNGSIVISGGTLRITASGDGIDANGTLEITGGHTTVTGPTQGDTATLDYDVSGTISGGTFIGTGASGMAQSFSAADQGVIALSVGNQAAGTLITLSDQSGRVLFSHAPDLSFAIVILSSPELLKGETYNITIGSASGSFAAK